MAEESTIPDLLELWREAAKAADRRDWDAAMAFFASTAVWEVEPLGIRLASAPAIQGFLADWFNSYEEYETDEEQGQNLGNGVVFVITRLNGRPVGSPSRVQERWAFTVTWAAGLIVRVSGNTDVDAARAAAERLAEEQG